MGSRLVLGLAMCYGRLGCLDNISLSSSVPITDSLDTRHRKVFRLSEYYGSKTCDRNKLIKDRWPWSTSLEPSIFVLICWYS